ncbi:uncharacterized protein LOC101239394 isoform X2 [Hydra vulgaris]|uniref:uncharacterized protein LOC101239394 isoform X2 n=1 Tax=Hydra vulgaris TaxID=6087 RepID=UPI001F5F20BC|nr:uncharacterized protein LOC101239394 isoform X2 [Hydra vulgaris]
MIMGNPLSINQSSYECGSFGSFTLFTLYFVVSPLESYLFQVINMNLTSNLSTSVIMIKPDATYINYDGAAVGFTYQASINSQNYFVNVTSTFKVGYVNSTTQFAMSFARLADSLSRLIIYLKPFKVVANVKNSNAGFNSTLFEATNGALKLRFFIKNDYFNSSGDAEDVVFIIYYNEKIISYKSYMHTVGGMVANVTFQLLTLPPNMIKIIIPRLRCGAFIQIIVYFLSLMNNRQPVESFFLELSATIYQNGTLLQLINKNITLLADVETQNRARNRRIIGDMLSLLRFNDLLLVCEWAIDRTRNYCGILSLEGAPTFTRFSVVFLEPICYDNVTQNIYFEDKFENIVVYNYLNPIPIRLSETKEKILQLPSITLPLTISKGSRVFGCNVKTQIGSYKETPYYMNSFGFIFNSSSIYNWVSPAIYTSTSFC